MYRINEIFYSLQGEGRHTGRPAVFVRFSGCNLRCPFCDTDFSGYTLMSADEIMTKLHQWAACRFVVITGGEPSLQIDDALVGRLHQAGYYVAIETNGTHALPDAIDWVTWSPKDQLAPNVPPLALTRINEVKVVFDGAHDPAPYLQQAPDAYACLQPCDTGDVALNQQITTQCVDYILQHPQWHLSLQTHKLLNIQ